MTDAVFQRCNLHYEDVKLYLRLDEDDKSELLQRLLAGAKQLADEYTNNPFLDVNGSQAEIPLPINEWILAHIARAFERRAEGLQSEGIAGLSGSVKWADGIDFALIDPYRLIPGI